MGYEMSTIVVKSLICVHQTSTLLSHSLDKNIPWAKSTYSTYHIQTKQFHFSKYNLSRTLCRNLNLNFGCPFEIMLNFQVIIKYRRKNLSSLHEFTSTELPEIFSCFRNNVGKQFHFHSANLLEDKNNII